MQYAVEVSDGRGNIDALCEAMEFYIAFQPAIALCNNFPMKINPQFRITIWLKDPLLSIWNGTEAFLISLNTKVTKTTKKQL